MNKEELKAFKKRRKRIIRLHEKGWSFSRIADELDISRQRAWQLYHFAKQEQD